MRWSWVVPPCVPPGDGVLFSMVLTNQHGVERRVKNAARGHFGDLGGSSRGPWSSGGLFFDAPRRAGSVRQSKKQGSRCRVLVQTGARNNQATTQTSASKAVCRTY